MTARTFADQCLAGEVDADAVEDFVAEWHNGDDPRSLAEVLGFTDDEYALWVEKPAALAAILEWKRTVSRPPT